MKRPLFAAITALFIASSSATQAGSIFLDPGHGGRDAGATEGQVKESEVMLGFSKILEAALKKKGYIITLSRGSDELVPLQHKAISVQAFRPDIILGLHLSTSKDPSKRGIRIFRAPESDDNKLSYQERELPQRLAKALGEMEPKQNVTLSRLGLPYLATPKALIIEFGYLSNEEDRKLILDPAHQQKIADVLAETLNNLY